MTLKFGTSGVRGLVTEMTDRECYLYAKAFARYLKAKASATNVALAGDRRNSTPRIMRAVAFALREEGLAVVFCGKIATPAVMNHGLMNGMASIMVTGSHIPDDRNGIKFNMPWGEVLKGDEKEISGHYRTLTGDGAGGQLGGPFDADGAFAPGTAADTGSPDPEGEQAYIRRYLEFFQGDCLAGAKAAFYEHSSVSRDVLPTILSRLGAEVIPVGRSESFVPVDTEAIEEPDRLAAWVLEHGADALLSTDGDGDRPLVVDESGKVVRGDVLGILVAGFFEADAVSTPVSCNTALEKSDRFAHCRRTRIGSPYVIASMDEAVRAGCRAVVGYEANGGFLTASELRDPETGKILSPLPTRDAALPIVAFLLSARRRGCKPSALVDELPARFTASGLLRGFPNEQGKALVARFEERGETFADELFSGAFGEVSAMDFTDGARMAFVSEDIVHLRPSGNAPEFRCYTEAGSEEQALRNNEIALGIVKELKE